MKTQRFLVMLVIANVALIFMFFTRSVDEQTQNIPQVIRAKEIELVDDNGKVRIQMNVEQSGEAVFRLRDADGTIRVKIGAGKDGSGMVLLDDQTEPALHFVANKGGASITLTGKEGKKKVFTP